MRKQASKQYVSSDGTIVTAKHPHEALRLFVKRRIGSGWTFTRMPDGWIVCINSSGAGAITRYKFRELEYDRQMTSV